MEPQIISETPITMAELREEVDAIKKRSEEPTMRVQKIDEYLQGVKPSKKTADLVKALKELEIPRLRDEHIVKIVDLAPETADELKIVMQGYPVSITAENLKKIAETVSKIL